MLDYQNRTDPDITSNIPKENKRRSRIALLLSVALSTWVAWLSWVSQPVEQPPEVLADVVFNEIIPYRDLEDLLYFWGETGGYHDHYVFDMNSGELQRDDGSYHYQKDKSVYSLKDGNQLRVQADGKLRRLLLEKTDGTRLVVDNIPDIDQPVLVSPDKNAFIYIGEGEGDWNLILFRLDSEIPKPLNKTVSRSIWQISDVVQWSSSGKYLLYRGTDIVSALDGSPLHRLDGSGGVWSPVRDEVAYVTPKGETAVESDDTGSPLPMGKRLNLWKPATDTITPLYHLPDDERVLGKPVWDPQGRYLTFPSGRESESEWAFEQVHVVDGKSFHYSENEQNVLPTRLTNLTLSPGGKYLSYSVNGMLKLINLNTQESRIYDYDAGDGTDGAGVRFDPDGVWMAREHEVLFVANNMEERVVYQTSRKILRFYLSSSADRLLVMEEMADGHRLRLINLQTGS